MVAKTPIHHQRERQNRSFRQRCVILAIFFGLFIIGLGVRLIQLQLKDHSHYASLSQNNTLSYIPIAPTRGLITDRNGVQLAINKPSATLALMPNRRQALRQTIEELRNYLPISDREEANFFKSLGQYRHYQPIPLKSRLSEKQVAQFYTNQYKLPGTLIQNELLRDYPTGSTMGALLGYVGRINNRDKAHIDFENYQAQPVIGKTGLESQYETILHGQSGAKVAETNANGHIIHLLKENPAVGGHNLTLTIDLRLQHKAEELLQGIEGSIVMLDPRNGEILAMANAPTFDNNLFSGGISHAEYAKLLNNPHHPLFNRALRGRFAPGSTIKPFYSIAALNDGLITPSTYVHDKDGTFQVPGTQHIYHDWTWFIQRGGHGWVDVKKALETSCDIFYYDLANRMGIRKMDQILDDYGFGQITGVDLPHELAGIAPTPEWKKYSFGRNWYTGDTIEAGIGQGYLSVTPLQLASSVGMLAMQGRHYQPHLVKATTAPDGTVTPTPVVELPPAPQPSKTAWHTTVRGMQRVIDGKEGTAVHFGPHPNFTVAGKTGTAQVYGHRRDEEALSRRNIPKKLRNNHLFIAFAPVKNPTVAIAVILEHEPKPDKSAGILLREYFKLQQVAQKPAKGKHT
jgi:penicillin-binding protein 2